MRAIIIDDKDAKALLERLELTKFHTKATPNAYLEPRSTEELIGEIHHRFHYVVCSWLQEQGCSTVR